MANEKFLDAFRALDTELKSDGSTVLDYENSLDTLGQERLKVCRIMRNYMAHNDTTFLATTNEQIKFLEEQVTEIRKKAHTVKDEMKRVKLIKATTAIKDVIASIDKFPIAPIETKVGLYLVDKDTLIHNLALGNKKIAIPARLPKYATIAKDERIENISSGTYVVTSDGTINGTYVGIITI